MTIKLDVTEIRVSEDDFETIIVEVDEEKGFIIRTIARMNVPKYAEQFAAAPELLEALELSTKILAETIGNLPNPGYGRLEGKVDARIIRNRALIAKAKGEA